LKLRIRNKKHYYTRLPLGIFLIILFTLSPLLIGLGGAWLSSLLTGEAANEGNSAWLGLPWLIMISLPIGILFFILYGIVVIVDSIKLSRQAEEKKLQ
jgi:uncharacterized protein with PQ loop repeat